MKRRGKKLAVHGVFILGLGLRLVNRDYSAGGNSQGWDGNEPITK